jgi:hypothetical protein
VWPRGQGVDAPFATSVCQNYIARGRAENAVSSTTYPLFIEP